MNSPPNTCPSRSCRDLNHGQPSMTPTLTSGAPLRAWLPPSARTQTRTATAAAGGGGGGGGGKVADSGRSARQADRKRRLATGTLGQEDCFFVSAWGLI